MARKRKTKSKQSPTAAGVEVKIEAAEEQPPSALVKLEHDDENIHITPYELERQRIIQRNRERLLALGIPSLVASLQPASARTSASEHKKKKQKTSVRKAASLTEKRQDGEQPLPLRRSSRVQQAQQTAEERMEFELGQFVIEGGCPRCGEEVAGGREQQKEHLEGCRGRALLKSEGRPAQQWRDVEMTEEERRDARKRTLARMKQLSLENLVEFDDDSAKFVVLGSTGHHYTVTLSSEKQSCQCMDYRFRRHHCKHICLALSHLGILDNPGKWHEAVEAKLSELVKAEVGEGGRLPEVVPPPGKEAEVALKLL